MLYTNNIYDWIYQNQVNEIFTVLSANRCEVDDIKTKVNVSLFSLLLSLIFLSALLFIFFSACFQPYRIPVICYIPEEDAHESMMAWSKPVSCIDFIIFCLVYSPDLIVTHSIDQWQMQTLNKFERARGNGTFVTF